MTLDIDMLRVAFGSSDYSYRYKAARIPLLEINVLPQPRQVFPDIPELALDVAQKGFLNPPNVAELSRDQCKKYLTIINLLWETDFKLSNLTVAKKRNGKEVFYVLLAGERRCRAARLLLEHGCLNCVEQYGEEKEGKCFRRHFGRSKRIEVRLCPDIPPQAALLIQFSENTYVPIPTHEEAHAYWLLYQLLRQANPKLSIAEFARSVGRTPGTVRKALKFALLPERIQKEVEEGHIAYGIAIQLARLQEDGVSDEDLNFWRQRAIAGNLRVPEFKKLVTEYIEQRHSPQLSLLEMMEEEAQKDLERSYVRITVERNTIHAVLAACIYFRKVLHLFEDGELGAEDSPFSKGSPVRAFRKHVDVLGELLPLMREFIPRREREPAEEVLTEASEVLGLLGEQEPVQPLG